ncbi:MAG: hypothetical protein ACRDDH_21445 [Cetobacterium sp.]|uniref:hypothetical protein n=1 Tax=Cetobacterium sp. TaxID=2071632 RepID=UPI003EE62C37
MYIYLDREKAKEGITLVYGVFEERKEDYKEFYEQKALEYEGNNLPHFITYILEEDSIREATEEEKLERGQRQLAPNEILKNGKIISYDITTQKIVNNEIIDKTREDYIVEGIITLESEKEKARMEREKQLRALDLYDKAVLRGDIKETEEMKKERDKFRKAWLEIPNNYDDINIPIEELYPMPIESIVYFL